MSEQIFATYSPTTIPGVNHTILNYVNSQGMHFIIEAVPENRNLSDPAKAWITADAAVRGEQSSAFGTLTVLPMRRILDNDLVDSNNPNSLRYGDLPREDLAFGEDLSSRWLAINNFGASVNSGGYAYLPFSQNSNTFAASAAIAGGLDRPTGFAIFPDDPASELRDVWPQGIDSDVSRRFEPTSVSPPPPVNTYEATLTDQNGQVVGYEIDIILPLGESESFILDTQHRIVEMQYHHIDGSFADVQYDPSGAHDWSQRNFDYDSQGHLVDDVTVYDNGSTGYDRYSTAAIAPVSTRVTLDSGTTVTTNRPVGGTPTTVVRPAYNNAAEIAGTQIGAIFGSSIGQALAGDNVFAQIAVGSGLSALASTFAGGIGHLIDDANPANANALPSAYNALNSLGNNLGTALQSQSIGSLSGSLTGELADALHLGNGPLGGIVRSATNSVTSTVLNNVVTGHALFDGLAGNITTGLGSYLGGYLAHQIVTAQTQAGAVGGQIGGSLGSLASIGIYSAVNSAVAVGNVSAFALLTTGIGEALATSLPSPGTGEDARRAGEGLAITETLVISRCANGLSPKPIRGTCPPNPLLFDWDTNLMHQYKKRGVRGVTPRMGGRAIALLAARAANDNALIWQEKAA
jgi:hypothetical protein